VYPTNVIYLATECSNRNHSAVFPVELPKWFIKLFTQPGDVVLDPFIGSGTTALAAIQLARKYVGIDISQDYVNLSQHRVAETQMGLPNIAENQETYQLSVTPDALRKAGNESA
jgi:DNA modification methylase